MNADLEKKAAQFFILSFLDERKAQEASKALLNQIKKKVESNPNAPWGAQFVATSFSIWKQMSGKWVNSSTHHVNWAEWFVPETINLNAWKEFQRASTEDELLTLLWAHVLKISETEIEMALKITNGTLRYRVGRALRKLGNCMIPYRKIPS